MTIEVEAIQELPQVARQILEYAAGRKVWLFYGNMGAGKTTLIKQICQSIGVEDNASSPTFSIVNEYNSPEGPVFHFDFYRIKSEHEALDLGYEEYFYSGNYCFVEWPELIPSLLPEEVLSINITVSPTGTRMINLQLD